MPAESRIDQLLKQSSSAREMASLFAREKGQEPGRFLVNRFLDPHRDNLSIFHFLRNLGRTSGINIVFAKLADHDGKSVDDLIGVIVEHDQNRQLVEALRTCDTILTADQISGLHPNLASLEIVTLYH